MQSNGQSEPTSPASEANSERQVKITQSFNMSIFKRLTKARKAKGLQYEQDVVRLAVAFFLDNHGF